MKLTDQIVQVLAKWKSAPSTQRIRDRFKAESYGAVSEALLALRRDGRIACTNERWHLLGEAPRFGATEGLRKRKRKKLDPKSAVARTVPLFGEDA